MSSLWDEIVAANDEVINALIDAWNISNWFNDTDSSSATSSSSSSSAAEPGIIASVVGSIVKHARRFVKAVNWSEPYFKVLLAFHLLVLAGTVGAIRNGANETAFVGWMLVLVGLVVMSSWLNVWGRDYVVVLFPESEVQYFDEHGVFISVTYSAPLVLQAILMMLVLVVQTAKLFVFVRVKKARADLRQQIRNEKKTK